jgi:two-component system capsular synthesis sensor histidine kinase RcsC
LAAKHEFPFILLDLELPGIKGPELAKRLRAMPSGASPVIVGMSAHDGRNARTRCMAAGMDAFLVKPVTSEQIRDAHAEAMSRRTAVHPVGGLDFAALELYAGKAPGGMPEAVRTYVDTLDREVSELRTAVNDRHPERMLAAVHRVHSHATIVGAARLFEAAEALESEIRAGRLPEGEDDIESVLNTAREVGKALIPLLTERAASGTGP